jgi:putative SOS response-associated peptidase YedK
MANRQSTVWAECESLDWCIGKAIDTRIEYVDGLPLGIAGLWSIYKTPKYGWVHSFKMLTINADGRRAGRSAIAPGPKLVG